MAACPHTFLSPPRTVGAESGGQTQRAKPSCTAQTMPVEYPYGGPLGSEGWGPNSPSGAYPRGFAIKASINTRPSDPSRAAGVDALSLSSFGRYPRRAHCLAAGHSDISVHHVTFAG